MSFDPTKPVQRTDLPDDLNYLRSVADSLLVSKFTAVIQADVYAALARLAASPAAPGEAGRVWRPTHRHVKRGSEYEVVGEAEAQVSTGPEVGYGPRIGEYFREVMDGHRLTVYRARDGKLWARFSDEFNDGRFEPLPPPFSDGE